MEQLLRTFGPQHPVTTGRGVTVSVFGCDDQQVESGRSVLETLRAVGAFPKDYEEVHLNDRRVTDLEHTVTREGDVVYVSPRPQGGA